MGDLRFGTIGTSMICGNFCRALEEVEGARLSVVFSRHEDTARAFAAEHGAKRYVTSACDLATARDVDAVYVASPNALHFSQALALVRAGKHVLVEKPLCANERQATELFAAAREAGVVAMEAMRSIHNPDVRRVRELSRRIGRLRRATLRYGKYSSRYDDLLAGAHTNIFDARMASGGLMDIGIYSAGMLAYLFGRPSRVVSVSVLLPAGTEGLTNGTLDGSGIALGVYEGPDGRPTHVVDFGWTKVAKDELPSQIEGESATVLYRAMDKPSEGHVTWRGKAVRNAGAGAATSVGDRVEELDFHPVANDMVYELGDFVRLVAAGAAAAPTPAEAGFEGSPAAELAAWQQVSLDELFVTDRVRAQAGVVFPADEA